MASKMTFPEWQRFARDISERAERVNRMRHERARRIGIEAGTSGDPCHVSNAMIAAAQGRPWRSTVGRMSLLRKSARLWDDWRASELARSIIDRAWKNHTQA